MSINKERELAKIYIEDTQRHIFLTGRAGSGKTTLLKEIIEDKKKNMVVVAPTGVAAINAGGITIHSLFQLPLTAFTPNDHHVNLDAFTNRPALLRHIKMSKEKRALIRALDLLIIDEISMVRPDMLDTIDFVLRKVRKNHQPFGNVQLLMVGDLYQLPPVIKDYEWSVLKEYYKGPYFFNSLVWQKAKMIPIELKKIYRQTDQQFVDLLNQVRDGNAGQQAIDQLNKRYVADFKNEEEAVTLTTHNAIADNINNKKLIELPGVIFTLKATISGKFFESTYPCSPELKLKKNAQVMFIRNDKDKRYFNGKLATVLAYDREEDELKVKFKSDGQVHWIQREEWTNDTYEVNKESQEIEKKELGSFSQFPIRLAWAVTVHKSQGLTLEQVVLDLGRSFAAGQAYVALSRCTSLKGITLTSKLATNNVIIDNRIKEFYKHFPSMELVESILPEAKKEYALFKLMNTFQFHQQQTDFEDWEEYALEKKLPSHDKIILLIKNIREQLAVANGTARDFQLHLATWIEESSQNPKKIDYIIERTEKGIPYFTNLLHEKMILPLHAHLDEFQSKSKVKKYLQLCENLYQGLWKKMEQLYALNIFDEKIHKGDIQKQEALPELKNVQKQTKKKGATYEITLDLFKEGLTLEEIAKKRELAPSTIEAHMTRHLANGNVQIEQLLSDKRIGQLYRALEGKSFENLSELRSQLNMDVSFGELRWMKIFLGMEVEKDKTIDK